MNKNELVSAVAEKAGITKADAASAVDAVFDAVQGELKNGGKKLICHAWAQHAPGGPEVAFDEIFDKAP